jgi:GntR family phosphonate transport system transcriptional regulator
MTTAQRYLDIADELTAELARAPVGERVPSEHAVAARFEVSRPTARAALQELERRFLVRRVRGLGTFRRSRISYVISVNDPPSFHEAVKKAGAIPHTKLLSCTTRRAVDRERQQLQLDAGTAVWVVERLFEVNGEVAGFATSVLPHNVLPGFARALADDGSLFTTLRRRYGYLLVRSQYRLGFDVPSEVVAGHLTGGDRGPLWLAESVNRVAGPEGRRIEYSRTYMRPEVLDVVFELEEGR